MATGSSSGGAAQSYSTDPALYIYTSLTAGSSHIVTATSRLETILRANRVPFKAIDLATDERARMLWGRRAGKDESGRVRKLPGLVQMGFVLGDLVEIEDWNEYGELKQHVTIYYDEFTQPPISQAPKTPAAPAKPAVAPAAALAASAGAAAAAAAVKAASAPTPPPPPPTSTTKPAAGATMTLPIRSVAEEAADKAKQMRLQSLRDKVYGKGGSAASASTEKKVEEPAAATKKPVDPKSEASSEEEEEDDESEEESSEDDKADARRSSSVAAAAAGLQSPTTSSWKAPPAGGGKSGAGSFPTIQSPTTGSWKPTDVDAPITSFLGSPLQRASADEIAAIERAETIKEEPDREDEDDSSDDDDSSEEEEVPQKGTDKAPAGAKK